MSKFYEVWAGNDILVLEFPDDATEEQCERECEEHCRHMVDNIESGWMERGPDSMAKKSNLLLEKEEQQ